jgi:GcrA cell cycle regulator
MSQTLKKAKKPKAPKTLMDLAPHDCRWPIGEPRQEGFHFCGEPQLAGRPYCARHWQMAFQPSKPRHQPQPAPALPAALPAAPAKKAA